MSIDALELRRLLTDEAKKLSEEAKSLPPDMGGNIQALAKLEVSKALISLSERIGKVQS